MITKPAMFSAQQMEIIEAAESRALEIVSNAYKMSKSQWLRNRYDIKTLKDLERKEIVDGPFAQIIRYESKKHPASLGSSVHDVYRICLQDNAILAVAAQYRQIQLLPFSLYIITHELIHIVRFSHYKQGFEATESEKFNEEKRVHRRTRDLLRDVPIAGMDSVLKFYCNWHHPLESFET